ncbi:MAG: CopG family transcriptional regulator [Thermoproteus sp.]
MSVVISIRVPKRLKEEMDKLRDKVNWSEEIRRYIERVIKEYERMRAVEEVERELAAITPVPKGTAAAYVREDRDSS